MKNTLVVKNLPMTPELDQKVMAALRGGIGRIPMQVFAWQASGQPATREGLIIDEDGKLQRPPI